VNIMRQQTTIVDELLRNTAAAIAVIATVSALAFGAVIIGRLL
jgi:hypothetical protein